jgi:hypothetical protein
MIPQFREDGYLPPGIHDRDFVPKGMIEMIL